MTQPRARTFWERLAEAWLLYDSLRRSIALPRREALRRAWIELVDRV